MNFFAILLPSILSIVAKYCAPTPAEAAKQRQRLFDTRLADGSWPPEVLRTGHAAVRRGIRAHNKGKGPKERIRAADVNLDEQAALTFAHVLATPPTQFRAAYTVALKSPLDD